MSSSIICSARRLTAPVQQQCQCRGYWQEFIRQRVDNSGKRKYEDPERVVKRFQDARRADGETLLDIHLWNTKHEKPWMKRRRMIEKKRYEFDKRHVLDLAKYIQFVQDKKVE
jgi:hypothetical protein